MSGKKTYTINLLNKSDQKLIELQDHLQSFSDADLKWSPVPEKWCAMQLCMHLKLGEELSLRNAVYNVGRIDQRPTAGLINTIRSYGLQFVLWSPIKFRSPEPVRVDTGYENETLGNVFSEWKLLRGRIMDFLEEAPEIAYVRQVYKHPRVNYLALHQMVKFFDQHFARHKKQMMKILELKQSLS